MKWDALSKDRRLIREMFAGIAGRYDLLNHLLSLNVDRSWRRRAARLVDPRPGQRILDLCTGTADLALELARQGSRGPGALEKEPGPLIVGADFCPEMVRLGEGKRRRAESGRGAGGRVRLGVADALRLPFAEASFDAVTVAFGIRNVCDLQAGLVEMLRVLKPGGLAVVLEFTTPARAWFRALFGLYFHRLLPRIGRLLAPSSGPGRGSAYRYLPDSVAVFPGAEGLAEEMTRAGFSAVRYRRLSLGIAALHAGRRPPAAAGGAEP